MSDEPVTLAQVKGWLKLEITDTDEDDFLNLLITAARGTVENYIDRVISVDWPIAGSTDLQVIGQSILMIVSTWYMNREADAAQSEMPMALGYLLRPLRRMAC